MRYDRLHAMMFATALTLLALPVPSRAAAIVDCDSIQNIENNESWKAMNSDLKQCINRGWPVPPGWVPDGGKGAGLTAGGAGGFSYGSVRAPESPPGSRNENASVSAAAITASCNFPPRIKIGIPPTISMPAGSCLDFMKDLFKDKAGNTSSSAPPVGVSPTDTCPADSNNASLYGVKQTATGVVPTPCGGMVPTATADLTLNANPTDLISTTAGSYYIWSYHKTGAGFAPGVTAVPLPTYLCGAKDKYGLPIKTVDLPPPVEQMITYKKTDKFVSIRLQARDTMPATFIPPYVPGAPEQFLILPLNAAGDPVVPANCSDPATYYKTASSQQDYLVQSALVGGSVCASVVPTMVNYPQCPGGGQPGCGIFKPHSVWFAICNPSNPPPAWGAKILPDAAGKCPTDISDPTCAPSSTTTDPNCDVVSMPINAASCPNQEQYMALNRPSLYYPVGSSATFSPISGRTQQMAQTVTGTRYYMQSNTAVTIQSTAPSTLFTEGGSITQKDGNKLIMTGPATLLPGSGAVTLPNGGQLVTAGGTLIASIPAGGTYTIPGGSPYAVTVTRSMTIQPGYMVPTVPTTAAQPPYVQLPITTPTP